MSGEHAWPRPDQTGGVVKGTGTFTSRRHLRRWHRLAGDARACWPFPMSRAARAARRGTSTGAIDDATAPDGPSPDANSHVDGWSTLSAGGLFLDADTDNKVTVDANPDHRDPRSNDVAGPWQLVRRSPTPGRTPHWTGTYSGPRSGPR